MTQEDRNDPKTRIKLELEEVPEDFSFESLRSKSLDILSENCPDVFWRILRVLQFVRNDEISTACITRQGRDAIIYYNGPFVYTYCKDPTALACLLAHEIFHHALGHLRRVFKGNQSSVNFAQDCVINRLLSIFNRRGLSLSQIKLPDGVSVRKEFHFTKFIEDFYKTDSEDWPEQILLRPPSFNIIEAHQERSYLDMTDPELGTMWTYLYRGELSEQDILNFLHRKYPDLKIPSFIILLGSTGGNIPYGQEEDLDFDDILNQVRKKEKEQGLDGSETITSPVISKSEAEEILKACKSEGRGGNLVEYLLDSIDACRSDLELEKTIRTNSLYILQYQLVGDMVKQAPTKTRSLIPEQITRSDIMHMASGRIPFFWKKRQPSVPLPQATAYIDVSGSMSSYYEWLYGVVLALSEKVNLVPILFSTFLKEVDMNFIREGRVSSGGGTDVDLVLDDILKRQNLFCSVVFSDGCFTPSTSLVKSLREQGREIYGIFFTENDQPTNSYRESFDTFCTKVYPITEQQSIIHK